ncbi:MAG TPA: hypothetical protein VER11_29440 [Polyangiaceae bacterium]|nr:hypothetical protein [Polyangiaceae bacterium]
MTRFVYRDPLHLSAVHWGDGNVVSRFVYGSRPGTPDLLSAFLAWVGIDVYGEAVRERSLALADQNAPDRHSGENNYLRHCIASCIARSEIGEFATPLMNGREYMEQFFGASKSHCDVDRHNNYVGALASQSIYSAPGPERDAECEDRCISLWGVGITNAADRG